jgi:hypothetical protein
MVLLTSEKRVFAGREYRREVRVTSSGEFRITLPPFVRRHAEAKVAAGESLRAAVEHEELLFRAALENCVAFEDVIVYKFEGSGGGREIGPPQVRLLAARYKLRVYETSHPSYRHRFSFVESRLGSRCLQADYGWALDPLPRVEWSEAREAYLLDLGKQINDMAAKFELAHAPARFDEAMAGKVMPV